MQSVRASEIGTYLFCARAWWYQQQGITPENQQQLNTGTAYHHLHGRDVVLARVFQAAGWLFLLAALVILAAGLTWQWLD